MSRKPTSRAFPFIPQRQLERAHALRERDDGERESYASLLMTSPESNVAETLALDAAEGMVVGVDRAMSYTREV